MSELGFTDAIAQAVDVSAEAPPSNYWSPVSAGEWLVGEICAVQDRVSRGRDGEDPREFRVFQVWGRRGDGGQRNIPRTEDGIFGASAELIPFSDGRAGVQRCLGMKVEGTDRRGAEVGDLILLRCLGKQGNSYRYGGYLGRLSKSHVPEAVFTKIAADEDRFARSVGGRGSRDEDTDGEDDL